MERGRGYFGGPAHTTAMPPKRRTKRKPDPYFEGIIAAGKERQERQATPKLSWPKLDYDNSYGHTRTLRSLLDALKRTKLSIMYTKWIQRKEKTKEGTRLHKIAHYMELYFHRKWDLGFAERHPLSAKHKRGIRWAKEQLKEST